ncbi:MAG: hypothetical protein HFJ76_06200 [Bacteroides thetaiotaomicron]|nr:hypothetical protein [Bacteroides thetaiotaomicron]
MTEEEKKLLSTFETQLRHLMYLHDELKKTATAISLNGSDVKETKLRLSKLVREVDKCIALLNE